ncbi:MAG: hypothetical protein QOD77_295 [Thermoplasmata archaeon]|nr:hypothetical protein [Thermoplasmata archaeon]
MRVLIVGGEDDIAESLRSLFAVDLPRQEIACAATPQQALEALRHGSPGLVLAAGRMPGTDGLSFLATVQERCPGARCCLVASWLDAPTRRRAEAQGVGVLAQPFDLAQLRGLAGWGASTGSEGPFPAPAGLQRESQRLSAKG